MFDKLKAAAKGLADKAVDAMGAGVEALQRPLEDLSAAAPGLEQMGYRLGDVHVLCALLPRVTVCLNRERQATEEEYQAALAAFPENRTFQTVAGVLRQADRALTRIQLAGRCCSDVEVELGLPPAVRLIFTTPAAGPLPPAGSAPALIEQTPKEALAKVAFHEG